MYCSIYCSQFGPNMTPWSTEKHPKLPKSLSEIGKTWTCSLTPTLKNLNFESMDELGKVRFQFKFPC